jgi:tRNA-specific 2-thiouridylase
VYGSFEATMRVFVGMSGGVDSSVAAMRLLERGYEVVGVFIKVWQPDFIHCSWEKERLDAMRVAAHLGIPFLTMNAEETYKREVADYMIRSYESGITPNPDVMCNEHVKFGAFYTWALEHGADKIATGHYARVNTEAGRARLLRGIDNSKDQSYFLWRMKQSVLENVIFPIGNTLKSDLRKEAAESDLPTASKADSQGICFLGEIDMYTFLSHYIALQPGTVLDEHGMAIGTHRGALLYTLGQRHGFTCFQGGDGGPRYVISRDTERNTITVSAKPIVIERASTITLSHLNELGTGFQDGTLTAVTRYHAKPIAVTLEKTENGHGTLRVPTMNAHDWVTGQSCVLYREDECVGGGIIS